MGARLFFFEAAGKEGTGKAAVPVALPAAVAPGLTAFGVAAALSVLHPKINLEEVFFLIENGQIVFCSAREAWPVVRRGGIAAVRAFYGARREGLLVKLMCSNAEKLAALAESLGIQARLRPVGCIPHINLTGGPARAAWQALKTLQGNGGGGGEKH